MTDFTTLNEDELVEHTRRNPEAFAAIYRRYLTPLYRYVYRRLGNVDEAEDITAQVFIAALEGLSAGRYRAGSCFPAWLFPLARHRLTDFYRRRPPAPLDENAAVEPGLLAAVEKGEDRQRLVRLLARLDERKQELLRLRFSAGLSFTGSPVVSVSDGDTWGRLRAR